MSSSPSKRRKTSPTTSLAIDTYGAQSQQVDRDRRQSTPIRSSDASYRSPTKASLARFNPHLLPPKPAAISPMDVPRARSTTPGRRSLGGMTAAPRRRSQTPRPNSSPSKPLAPLSRDLLVVLASPPHEAEETTTSGYRAGSQLDHELQNATIGSLMDETSPITVSIQQEQDDNGEPDLPLTPTQLGKEPAPDLPKGILFSSPTRRARRKRVTGVKSSPLKPRDHPPEETQAEQRHRQEEDPHVEVVDSQKDVEATEDVVIAQKRKQLDLLSNQLYQLQRDVTCLEDEVDRMQDPARADSASQEELNELLSILTSTNPTHKPLPPPPKPPPLSQRLSLFLPFSKPPPTPSPTASPELKSTRPYHPIPLPDPLPHLRAFTPLTITSTSTLLNPTTAPLLRQETITLTSPQNLLTTTLALQINTTTSTLSSLSLLDLSPWATPELGAWITTHAIPNLDIAAIGWAAGRYWDVAKLRAECWASCRATFAPLLILPADEEASPPSAPSTPPPPRDLPSSSSSPSSPSTPTPIPAALHPSAPPLKPPTPLSRHTLSTHLGRRSLLFHQRGVSLVVTWTIGFDWTGEVESRVSAYAAVPRAWTEKGADEDDGDNGALGQIGMLFEGLVQRVGVKRAVEGVVGLVFGDEEGDGD